MSKTCAILEFTPLNFLSVAMHRKALINPMPFHTTRCQMKSNTVFPIAVLAICAAASVSAVEFPVQKSGVWETTTKGARIPGGSRSMSMCIDAATQAEAMATMKKMNCSKNEWRHEGNTWTGDSVCTVMGNKSIVHVVTTMSGENAYHTESTSQSGDKSSVMTIDGKWLGACKPGQIPGVPMKAG